MYSATLENEARKTFVCIFSIFSRHCTIVLSIVFFSEMLTSKAFRLFLAIYALLTFSFIHLLYFEAIIFP